MIHRYFPRAATLVAILLVAISAPAAVITNNLTVSPLDTSYDGTDLVISNCTVTLDGAHSFNSLLLTNGGVLTHSYLTNASASFVVGVTDEPQTLNGTNAVTLLHTNVSPGAVVMDTGHTIAYTNDIDFVQTNLADGTTQLYRTETSSIPDGATVLVTYGWAYSVNAGLNLTVTNDVSIASDASINANGIGYGGSRGTGHGWPSTASPIEGSGAGYGGNGGICSAHSSPYPGGLSYGSVSQPANLGSGGGPGYAGPGGAGGGLVQIIAGGNLNVDGAILVNGADATNSRAGGGSGGGVWLSAGSLSGNGSIQVNGGAGEPIHGGGGGGGRISIQCGTNNFSGSFSAYGGNGWQPGGAGTIFTQLTGQNGALLVDNNGKAGAASTLTLPPLTDVTISHGAIVIPSGAFSCNNLVLATNGTLAGTSLSVLIVSVAGNLTIQPGGILSVDESGFAPGTGTSPGRGNLTGSYYPCSGGGHGGNGGWGSITNNAAPGTGYGSQSAPTTFGSGGGGYASYSLGGYGGGALQLTVSGALQLDGLISANGSNGLGTGGGGGAGGSVYLLCTSLTGSGTIMANGGAGVAQFGGGGGGGRIAVIAASKAFNGTFSAVGGGGFNYGGAGTIYLQAGNQPQLILDNGGHVGGSTLLQSASSANLIVQNAAKGTANTAVTFASLLVTSNAWLTQFNPNSSSLTINGNATFQSGGGFLADLGGKPGGQGSGVGAYSSAIPSGGSGGGGGYAGRGGNSISNAAAGGYYSSDLPGSPSSIYSGAGGGGTSLTAFGGFGGGFIQMNVNGTLQLDGYISANGGDGNGNGGGGGAGGGIYLNVGTFTCSSSGRVTANGGNGANLVGGGGGGGRIAIYYNTFQLDGTLAALGGGGANYGGAGTIYLKRYAANHATLIVDNGGHTGADTPFPSYYSSPVIDLTLRNGAGSMVSGSVSFGDLVVSSNSWMIVTNGTQPASTTLAAANVTVQSGGSLNADFSGYVAGAGSGSGSGNGSQSPYYACSGAGHGGYGATGNSNLLYIIYPAGPYYDNAANPTIAGSGGGSASSFSTGGRGGGVIQMTLTGNLLVDGRLSANGGNGSGSGGGGGAGGSLNVACGSLSGSGTITVNGGNGVANVGGGGAGGLIAMNVTSNVFSGTISAYGGGGANYGGAGTIYFRTNFSNLTVLIADNGGHRGANTPLTSANNWIIRNAAVAQPANQNFTLISLLVESNAWLMPTINGGGQLILNVLDKATVQAGGSIVADALGYTQNQGTGHGVFNSSSPLLPGSGAGYGGYGSYGFSNLVSGGVTYGSTTFPTLVGSGGGGSSANSIGGAGGGYVNLHVNGTLQLDGIISANGGNGSGSGGGGGSGGSLNLNFGTLAGSGSISANGGNGANTVGGGGGGGRIALYFNTNLFAGAVSAYGGGGWAYGGAGTVYYKTNSQNLGRVVLDNADHAGTNSSFDFIPMNLTVQKKAIGLLPASGSWSPNDILIRTNGTLAAPVSTSQRTVMANNITIENGGALTADSAGYGPQSGPGAGYTSTYRGGAGHGGYGGYNPLTSGNAYDSISAPAMAGSGGGTISLPPYTQGGYGGGALKLNVAGTLTVNGRLSANGGDGGYSAGGGSGGSLYLQNISFLTGNGIISANGGSTAGTAGGGGGGRIAMNCLSNNFTGQITAYGGSGQLAGGAGTIYQTGPEANLLRVDNGGLASANTPLAASFGWPATPFDLNIAGAATVVPLTPLPLLSNLTIATSSTLTMAVAKSNLTVAVLHDLNLAGSLHVDYLGFPQANGSGAGTNISSQGSGGGYGGAGGSSSSGAPGGITYGSATQPVDFGSGGGSGANTFTGGSEGGGALRISVGGTFNVTGSISADGNYGWQDDSGGGAGGSVWIAAKTLAGTGNISAAGGDGDLFGGGGGGGGRIAIYAPTNLFAGTTNVSGGFGAWSGASGTIFLSSVVGDFQISAQSPIGIVSNTVSFVDVSFNEAVDPASVSASAFTLVTPAGIMPGTSLNTTVIGVAVVRVSFPVQNLIGDYSFQVAPVLTNILGQPLAQGFTGNFTITLPTISGTVNDTNGAPVAGVLVQPAGGLIGATTDANGNYSIGVPSGWNGTLTPSLNTSMFVPGSLAYTNITDSLTNQNFVIVPTIAPNLLSSLSGTNLSLGWSGLTGVTYQAWWSTNLVDWLPYGDAIPGTNGPQQIVLPVDALPSMFYRVGASD